MAEEQKPVKRNPHQEVESETLVRILGYDIPGSKNLYLGLTYIKGVSWALSHAICIKLNLDKTKKIVELSKDDIHKIESFMRELPIPEFLKNRRFDPETGETKHFYGADLDMKKEFDIKRLIKMKSYKGIRHATGQPVRGQKTRSHFRNRKNKKTTGLKREKKKEVAAK
ncbi:MAG: 30S ribosomal protein S13 [Nanoarchaeota archaeon]|nr:30S ribosomal protein S13 [Nanoarchaeota archaeon]